MRRFGWFKFLSRRQALPAVFVLGTFKGGTTAIARLLADACALSATLDIRELWYPNSALLMQGRLTLREVVRRHPSPFRRQLVKEPYLTFLSGPLRALYPDARYVHVIRDPRDNVRSMLDRMQLPGDLANLDGREQTVDARWRDKLMPDLWRSLDPHYVSVLAAAWCRGVEAFLNHRDATTLIRYEDFMANKAAAIDDLAARLSFSTQRDVSKIRLNRQFKPRGSHRDVPWLDFFGPTNLDRIERICASGMRELGYAPTR